MSTLPRAAAMLAQLDGSDSAAVGLARETLETTLDGSAGARDALREMAIAVRVQRGEPRHRAEAAIDAVLPAPAAPADWPVTPQLPAPPEPDALPIDALPPVLRDHVTSVAAATQTPPCMGALLAISAVSAAVRGRADVSVDTRGWTERLCMYAAVVLPTGARKSPVYAEMTSPLATWEREAAARVAPERQRALDTLELRKRAHEAALRDGEPHAVDAARLRFTEADAVVPAIPRLMVGDATPEALVRLMAEQDGSAALMAPEGDPLRIADGRYARDGAPRTGELTRAWSGESIRVDRVGRDPVFVRHPALTMSLCLQPSVLESLTNGRSMRGEGVWARILWLAPDARLGSRRTGANVPALDTAATARYAAMLRRILDDPQPCGQTRTMRLSAGALEVVYAAEAAQERALDPEHDEGIADWRAKACGQAVRIAALLQIAARAERGDNLWDGEIAAGAMQSAIRLVDALATHARAVLGQRSDPRLARMTYVIRRLRTAPESERTVRDLWQRVRGRTDIECVDDLQAVLIDLENAGCVRRVAAPRTPGPGRPASPRIELHPSLSDSADAVPLDVFGEDDG